MITTFLATIIGWYLVTFGLLVLFRREHVQSVMGDVLVNRGMFFIIALITFILGLLMVVSHNIWVMGWPLIITLFSWLVLVSGLIRLFFPEYAPRMAQSFIADPARMNITAIVLVLIGLYLLFHVYYLHV